MIKKHWTTKAGLAAYIVFRDNKNPDPKIYDDFSNNIFEISSKWYCGYVGVPIEHPCFKTDYLDVPGIEVHGGITYSGHLPAKEWGNYPRIKTPLHYFGYDCNHGGDNLDICDLDYCTEECEQLADQLSKITEKKE